MSGKSRYNKEQLDKMFNLIDNKIINQAQAAERFGMSPGNVTYLKKQRKKNANYNL